MKKKTYVSPSFEIVTLRQHTELLAGSGVSSNDILFGGVDEEGLLDPTAPALDDAVLDDMTLFK